jgi:WD40 repeat protein
MTSGQTIRQYEGAADIRSVQFLPDGTAFLTGGEAGPRLWPFRVENGVPQVGLPNPLTPPSARANERAALSPDGKRFAAVGGDSWLGSVAGDQAPIRIEQGDLNTVLGFSPDGRWLCLSRWKGAELKIRDAFTGAFVTNLPSGAAGFRFTPAGDQLVSVLTDRLTFWEVGTWRRLREIPFGDEWKRSDVTAFWPDGSCIFTCNREAMLQLWDPKSNREIATLWLPIESAAGSMVFDPTGRGAATSAGRPYVDLWDFPALRRELDPLGLDWPGAAPSTRFKAARRPDGR